MNARYSSRNEMDRRQYVLAKSRKSVTAFEEPKGKSEM